MNRMQLSALAMTLGLGLSVLGGCESDRLNNIPANAMIASAGDDRLAYTASSAGTIWVYDVTHDRIDYSGPIGMNESVSVDPESNTVSISGRVVTDKLDKGAKHRIYFVAGPNTSAM
jgi:hypothetical protein